MDISVSIIVAIISCVLGWFIHSLLTGKSLAQVKKDAELLKQKLASEADELKQELRLKNKEELDTHQNQLENEYRQRLSDVKNLERDIKDKEFKVEKNLQQLQRKEQDLDSKFSDLELEKQRAQEIKNHYKQQSELVNQRLEQIAGMTKDDVLNMLKENLMLEAQKQAAKIISDTIDEAKENAQRQAKDIILQAIYETSADHSVDSTVSIVNLPDDSMKGRIIGREGRNIRSFEMATGVDVLIDDTPEMIVLSCFDPIRRETAKLAMERLIEDGRIHPGRIEDVLDKVKSEMNDRHFEIGEQALFEIGIHNVHSELIMHIGKLRFRTIGGQNALKHSIEVAHISAMIAVHMNMDATLVKRAAIFHEIGRAVEKADTGINDRSVEILKKYGENPKVIEIIEAMSDLTKLKNRLSFIVMAAKTISNIRPGARKDIYESFVKRLSDLEEFCKKQEGVNAAYAIQTGREVRVMVDSDRIDDQESASLASRLVAEIEAKMVYAGQIKVSVYREYRAIDYAK